MSLSLLLLLVYSSHASHFMGTMMTYYPKDTNANGSVKVVLRYKTNFHSCLNAIWGCLSGDCGTEISSMSTIIDNESHNDWCQNEVISTRLMPNNAPFTPLLDGGNWISNQIGITSWKAVTGVELRSRSDTGKANSSPQTTILPLVRVPSNCQRDFNLLAFDPDGDDVQCRYGNTSLSECYTCTPPPVLSLSSSCTLSFSPTNSSAAQYVVQLVMEDFPKQTIILTQTNGTQTTITTNNAISRIPVQFAFSVDPVVASCTDGLYLPRFLPPTPTNRAQLLAAVNQTLVINIQAEANISTISELLFSGPSGINLNTSGPGQFILGWKPSEAENGESHPVCFLVQATLNSTKYHSELRCVIVTVEESPTSTAPTKTIVHSLFRVVALETKNPSLSPLSEEYIKNTIIQQLKDELVKRGIPANITLRIRRIGATDAPDG